jgi:hypothetical protein
MKNFIESIREAMFSKNEHSKNIKQYTIDYKFYNIICEREKDKSTIDSAEELYFDIIRNYSTAVTNNNVVEVKTKEGIFNIIITNTGLWFGEENINGNTIKALSIGNDLLSNTNGDVLKFLLAYKTAIIHELIHKDDQERVKKKINSDTDSDDYYINPMEFNAYYLQFAELVYDTVKFQCKTPNDFYKKFGDKESFIKYFWDRVNREQPELKSSLDKKYTLKWNKRIYQLYYEIVKYLKEPK